MQNRWNDTDAESLVRELAGRFGREVALGIYATRLIGLEHDLAMHGGGNTSVKARFRNILGETMPSLVIKSSGCSMTDIKADDFLQLDLERLKKLRALPLLSDEAMADQFRTHLLVPDSRLPSIESLMHSFLPSTYVFHTHASAILGLTNRIDAKDIIKKVFRSDMLVLDYMRAGFDLAVAVAKLVEMNPACRGILLTQHGIVTWAQNARDAYRSMIDLVTKAEEYLKSNSAIKLPPSPTSIETARKRYRSLAAGIRGILASRDPLSDQTANRIILRPIMTDEVLSIIDSEQGKKLLVSPPLTPDYLIRTKALPLWVDTPNHNDAQMFLGQVREAASLFAGEYKAYLKRHAHQAGFTIDNPDLLPRVAMVPGLGVICLGRNSDEANMVHDITLQSVLTKKAIFESGGTYSGFSEDHLFDMEYRSFQRAKLDKGKKRDLQGTVALVTGSAGAIGTGICQRLLDEGCHVAITDLAGETLDATVASFKKHYGDYVAGVALDVTDPGSVSAGFQSVIEAFGGVDLIIVNAGIAHVSPLADMDIEKFRKLEKVNVEGTLLILKEAAAVFKQQRMGGDIILISTKNVFAPGAKFGAYSATKAASHQLARIASLEFADLGVRVNMVSPDAVFSHGTKRSGLWAEVGPDRMKARGLDEKGLEEYYQSRNLLKARVTAEHVANAVMFFATRQTPTTGATIPVDGGLPDATPR